jgi:hypothetical protein
MHAMRQRRQAERGVQRAGEFGQVVGVGRGAGHVQVRRFVRQRLAGDGEGGGSNVHRGCSDSSTRSIKPPRALRADTLTSLSGSGASRRVSSQKRLQQVAGHLRR